LMQNAKVNAAVAIALRVSTVRTLERTLFSKAVQVLFWYCHQIFCIGQYSIL
jgi:hypothetical protein